MANDKSPLCFPIPKMTKEISMLVSPPWQHPVSKEDSWFRKLGGLKLGRSRSLQSFHHLPVVKNVLPPNRSDICTPRGHGIAGHHSSKGRLPGANESEILHLPTSLKGGNAVGASDQPIILSHFLTHKKI